jgi:hypothetical protein
MCLFVLRVKCVTTVCTELATHPPVYGVPLNARTRAPSLTRAHLRRNEYIGGRFVLRGLMARTGAVSHLQWHLAPAVVVLAQQCNSDM